MQRTSPLWSWGGTKVRLCQVRTCHFAASPSPGRLPSSRRNEAVFVLFSQLDVWAVLFTTSACGGGTRGTRVCVRKREREGLRGSSPVSYSSLYVCHLLSATPAWPTSAWPTRLHGSSGLFPLVSLCLICSLPSLPPAWGPVLTSLIDSRNRITGARKDVERPRWIVQKVLAGSQRLRWIGPPSAHSRSRSSYPRQCTHTSRSESERGRKGNL